MATQHIVVDGSNIATEGRSVPNLAQLESAIAELHKDLPDTEVTAVVDATFAHRIDPSELERFEAAALRGEYVYPPAGAIGRGDAFLLRIAEKVGGTVLSNDSFQEFHGEHPWLFEQGRLLGATPVPGVGWIFVPRTPVRGPRSRVAVRDADRAKDRVEKAIAVATAEVIEPGTPRVSDRPARRTDRAIDTRRPLAVNAPMVFISFIAEHPLGAMVEGEVDSFTSHGAVILLDDVRCYAPLSGLGNPPPRGAREVLRKGERRTFVVTALDPFRRGIELALPDIGVVSGKPSDETVAAELAMTRTGRPRRSRTDTATPAVDATVPASLTKTTARRAPRRGPAREGSVEVEPTVAEVAPPVAEPTGVASRRPRKAVAKAAPDTSKAAARPRKVAAKKAAPPAAPAKQVTAGKRAPARVPAKRSPAEKTAAPTAGKATSASTPATAPSPRRSPSKVAGARKAPSGSTRGRS